MVVSSLPESRDRTERKTVDTHQDELHPLAMPKGEHTAMVEKQSSYDAMFGRNVLSWLIRCECGWEHVGASRVAVRDVHRCHKEGTTYQAPVKPQKASAIASHRAMAEQILRDEGPLRSEEVRGAFFRRGKTMSEPTARKVLHAMVEEGQIESRELVSKRSRRIVLYFLHGTAAEVLEAKVRAFDRAPSGFAMPVTFSAVRR
jgi:hypothetical protein